MNKQNDIDLYVQAATRENTRKSYQSSIKHYEIEWGGYLPATSLQIAEYLSSYAKSHSINTLRTRLSALSSWHQDQGFADPTRTSMVKKVLKGIGETHFVREKQAKPIQIETLQNLDEYFNRIINSNNNEFSDTLKFRCMRDRALIYIGFWKAFRSDELCRMRLEHCSHVSGRGLEIFLSRSKTDNSGKGRTHLLPELKSLCPVSAYLNWKYAMQVDTGPVFRSVSRWGKVGSDTLHIDSIIPILRKTIKQAGLDNSEKYSSHSLRRGFASWANDNDWNLHSLMGYVGWKKQSSALNYINYAGFHTGF